jgi:O-antigen ligase
MAVMMAFRMPSPSTFHASSSLVLVLDSPLVAVDEAVDRLDSADMGNSVGTLAQMLSNRDLHVRAMEDVGIDSGEADQFQVTVTSPRDALIVTVDVAGPGPEVVQVAGEIGRQGAAIADGAFPGLALEVRPSPVSTTGGEGGGNPIVSTVLGFLAALAIVGGAFVENSRGRWPLEGLKAVLHDWIVGEAVPSRTRYGPGPDARITVLALAAVSAVLVLIPGHVLWVGLGAAAGLSTLVALRFPRLLVIGLVVLVLFNLSDIGTDFFGLPGISVPYTLFVIVVLAIRTWALGEDRRSWLGLGIAIAALVAVMSISGIFAEDQAVAFERTIDLIKNGLLVLLIVVLIRDLKDLRRVIWVLIIGTSFLSLLGIARSVTGSTPGLLEGFSQVVNEVVDEEVVGFRIAGPLGDANFFGQFLVLVFPFALERAFRARVWIPRVTAALATLLIAGAVVLTYSRGALIGLVVATVVALVFIRPALRTVLVALFVSALVLFLTPSQYFDRIGSLVQVLQIGSGTGVQDPSLQGRLGEMVVGMEMFHDYPVTGVGPGNYPSRYVEYSSGIGIDYRLELRQPHSLPIEVAAELGILGLAWWTIAAYLLGSRLLGARRFAAMHDEEELRHYLEALCVSFAGFAATSLFLHLAFSRSLWMMVGIAVGAIGLTRSQLDRTTSLLVRQAR